MASQTINALVTRISSSSDELRIRENPEHPLLGFLFDHQYTFDHGNMKNEPYTTWNTKDFTFEKTDGTTLAPGETSWNGLLQGYAAFAEHSHQPRYCCIYESNGGWEMIGVADIYGNFHAPGEKTAVDRDGRKWDVSMPGAFVFHCIKDESGPKGFKIARMSVYGDGVPVVGQMVKRGMIKPEDLLK